MLRVALALLLMGGLRNVNENSIRTLSWDEVRPWLIEDFVESWYVRSHETDKVHTVRMVDEADRTVHASFPFGHGGNQEHAPWVPQSKKWLQSEEQRCTASVP